MPTPQRRWLKYVDAETVARLCHMGLKPAGLVEGHLVGDHRSPFHGFAIEFAGHRQYVPGDDPKHLDWRAYSRTGRYLVKQYEQETNFNAHMVVDVSETMLFEHEHGRKIDYAAFIAVALAHVIVNQSDAVGALLFDNDIRQLIRVSTSTDVVANISEALIGTEPKNASAIGDVLCLLAERIGRRQVVFIISDFFADVEDTFRGVRRLLDDRHEIVLLHLVDPVEIDFELNGKIRLLELEGAGKLEVVGHEIRESYCELFREYLTDISARAARLGIDYVLCRTDESFGQHLAEYLSRRALKYG
ncbi:MAG: DUF58 domain-containing protein [Lentisphaerae bacterium]|jgi:uncharacterized protein (DUF58 family)|nr:DUF58 domain-containing protein [Lentisphaerota bacterium]MBT4820690.1 DUF58 domain-containing protein [Lentisphaerota bacterium]MBT5610614.1 DUF58 domain-containing protein [Lentisphaerota bacterium]MBT7053861.1 DUF58 domain-containing protein [Lentisphaerota bacterium]MBT7847399.1 DUF58 domain-containing protein [Lentisphaerota bacterium]